MDTDVAAAAEKGVAVAVEAAVEVLGDQSRLDINTQDPDQLNIHHLSSKPMARTTNVRPSTTAWNPRSVTTMVSAKWLLNRPKLPANAHRVEEAKVEVAARVEAEAEEAEEVPLDHRTTSARGPGTQTLDLDPDRHRHRRSTEKWN